MSSVIYLNKAPGMTSFDVCFGLRKVFATKTIGHTGTLDPMAKGVMIILVDKATKANQFLSGTDKEYIASVEYGYETDTLDKEGNIVKKEDYKPLSKEELEGLLKGFIGTYTQEPPLTSAIKVDGMKLYEYQRKAIPVDIPKRPVTISDIELLDYSDEGFTFRCSVSAGTYIRALVRDMLAIKGMIGTLVDLERTRVGNVRITDCDKYEDILEGKYTAHSLYEVLSPLYEVVEYDNPADIKNGKRIFINSDAEKVLIVHKKEVLAIYKKTAEGPYRSLRGLF